MIFIWSTYFSHFHGFAVEIKRDVYFDDMLNVKSFSEKKPPKIAMRRRNLCEKARKAQLSYNLVLLWRNEYILVLQALTE